MYYVIQTHSSIFIPVVGRREEEMFVLKLHCSEYFLSKHSFSVTLVVAWKILTKHNINLFWRDV
jgi:hypothetical protein